MEPNSSPTEEAIQVLIVPLRGLNIVVPQSMVVEIQPVTEVGGQQKDVDWLRGEIDWRGRKVPLVSLEAYCGLENAAPSGRSRRVAVLHGLGAAEEIGSYAIEIHSIPHPVRISRSDVIPVDSEGEDCELFLHSVKVAGVYGQLVDFDRLETGLQEILSPSNTETS